MRDSSHDPISNHPVGSGAAAYDMIAGTNHGSEVLKSFYASPIEVMGFYILSYKITQQAQKSKQMASDVYAKLKSVFGSVVQFRHGEVTAIHPVQKLYGLQTIVGSDFREISDSSASCNTLMNAVGTN